MSDFQKFLDQSLKEINVDEIKEEEPKIYDYDIYREISITVVETREGAGLTQKQLASLSGLTQANISNIEKGVSRPTIDSLKKIADAVGKRLIVEFIDREELI